MTVIIINFIQSIQKNDLDTFVKIPKFIEGPDLFFLMQRTAVQG